MLLTNESTTLSLFIQKDYKKTQETLGFPHASEEIDNQNVWQENHPIN